MDSDTEIVDFEQLDYDAALEAFHDAVDHFDKVEVLDHHVAFQLGANANSSFHLIADNYELKRFKRKKNLI